MGPAIVHPAQQEFGESMPKVHSSAHAVGADVDPELTFIAHYFLLDDNQTAEAFTAVFGLPREERSLTYDS